MSNVFKKGDTYILKRKTPDVFEDYAKIVIDSDAFVNLHCYLANSWDIHGDAHGWEYLAGVTAKWDSCTHWYFYGEDYDEKIDTDIESYYHICGEHCFLRHIRAMCFIWKLASTLTTARLKEHYKEVYHENNNVEDEYFRHPKTKALVDMMLEGYEIVKLEDKND